VSPQLVHSIIYVYDIMMGTDDDGVDDDARYRCQYSACGRRGYVGYKYVGHGLSHRGAWGKTLPESIRIGLGFERSC